MFVLASRSIIRNITLARMQESVIFKILKLNVITLTNMLSVSAFTRYSSKNITIGRIFHSPTDYHKEQRTYFTYTILAFNLQLLVQIKYKISDGAQDKGPYALCGQRRP